MRDYIITDGHTDTFYSLTVDHDRTAYETVNIGGYIDRITLTRGALAARLRAYRNDPKRYSIVRW